MRLYNDLDRFDGASESAVKVEVDTVYRINHEIGFFLIAYPKKDEETNFSFEYNLFAENFVYEP